MPRADGWLRRFIGHANEQGYETGEKGEHEAMDKQIHEDYIEEEQVSAKNRSNSIFK